MNAEASLALMKYESFLSVDTFTIDKKDQKSMLITPIVFKCVINI